MAGSPASTAMSRRAGIPPMSMRASSRSPSTPTRFAALMGYFEARKGRWRSFTGAVWADLGFPGHLNYDINRSASGNPFARLPDFKGTIKGKLKINANAQLDYQETIIHQGVAFEVAKWGVTRAPTRPWTSWAALAIGARTSTSRSKLQGTLTADVQADFRRVGLDLKRKVKGSRAIAVAHAGDLEWVDPVVGGRVRSMDSHHSSFGYFEGDVGGFGAGSEFSWQAVATYGFDVNVFNTTRCAASSAIARCRWTIAKPVRMAATASTGSNTARFWALPSAGSPSTICEPIMVRGAADRDKARSDFNRLREQLRDPLLTVLRAGRGQRFPSTCRNLLENIKQDPFERLPVSDLPGRFSGLLQRLLR